MKLSPIFAVVGMIGIVLIGVGITMPDRSLAETLTFLPGVILYLVGFIGGCISIGMHR